PAGMAAQVDAALERLEQHTGKRPGDPVDPQRVSVRPGAPGSMLGWMDTVRNLRLTDAADQGPAARTANQRFAWDSDRRFVQMYANVVRGVAGERLEGAIDAIKRERGVTLDTELDEDALRELTGRFKAIYAEAT